MDNEFNVDLTYNRIIKTVNIKLPEGYTKDDVRSIKDGKWGTIYVELKDGKLVMAKAEAHYDDFRTASSIDVYNKDWGRDLDLPVK